MYTQPLSKPSFPFSISDRGLLTSGACGAPASVCWASGAVASGCCREMERFRVLA